MTNNQTDQTLTICETCDMPRLKSETITAWGFDETPLHTACDSYKVECGDYGKVRPCEECGDIFLTDDLTSCEFYGHGLAICRPCHENAGGSWRCYTER